MPQDVISEFRQPIPSDGLDGTLQVVVSENLQSTTAKFSGIPVRKVVLCSDQ